MANQYAYRILTVGPLGNSYLLSDWGLDGAKQQFHDAKEIASVLTERGQDGWRLCQYSPAPAGWPQGVYLLEQQLEG